MRQAPSKTPRYQVEEIPISLIDFAEQMVRDVAVDDDIHELAGSIAALDLLQFPGVIRKEDGRFALAWGRRRLEAFKLTQSVTIPCRVYHGSLDQVKALALVENMQRKQMSIEEESRGVIYLAEEKHLSIDQIVTQLGRSRTWVLQRLAVPNLKPEIREALLDGAISLGAAEALDICVDDSARAYLLSQAIHAKLPIAEIRALVKQAEEMPTQHDAIAAGMEAAGTQIVYQQQLIRCAACQRPRPVAKLQFVRVCNDGCKEETDGTLTESTH